MSKKKRKRSVVTESAESYRPVHINELLIKPLEEFTDSDWRKVLRLRLKLERLSK